MSACHRKLPGHRRGFITSNSVWMGDDHLLAVRSTRFREEYKRFHFRDVQAIAVAEAPRFHFSTRALGLAIVYVVAAPILAHRYSGTSLYWWSGTVAIALAWAYVSAYCKLPLPHLHKGQRGRIAFGLPPLDGAEVSGTSAASHRRRARRHRS